jgi:putative colanic acid biosynthesis UDP-glucose lipid carrier transferase
LSSSLRLSSPKLRYLAWALDVFIIIMIAIGVYVDYHHAWTKLWWPEIYTWIVVGSALLLGLFSDKLYRSWRVNDLGVMLRSVMVVWALVMTFISLALFFSKTSTDVSRIWFIAWGVLCWCVLSLQRLLVYWALHWLRRKGYNYKTILLVGFSPISEKVLQTIQEAAWSGLRVVDHIESKKLEDYLIQLNNNQPNEIWLCMPMSDESGIRTALSALRHSVAEIRLVPDLFSVKLINHGISRVLGIPMLDLSTTPVTGLTRIAKALEDIILGGLIFILISPIMVVVALAIKFSSPGPILFKQKRLGWNGKVINVYKFRTMNKHEEEINLITQASRNDPRLTPIGTFLRKYSLDELPQFFNVLQGRMSIVGPRPHAIVHNDYYKELVPRYMLRHKVKPGITGWAQINGYRGETDTLDKMEKRVEFDLHYIENMSIFLDFQIIIKTILKIFKDENAY